MPELRRDPVVRRWVIVSTERGKRPSDFGSVEEERKGGFCPFDYGNEDKTPPEIMAYREAGTLPNTPGWWVRVVPNKFPALQIEGDLNRAGVGMYDMMNGIGAHEVIIETPDHNATLATLPDKNVQDVLWAYRDRMMDLKKDTRLKYVLIFKNQGKAAGASLEHPHSQLIATPIVPKRAMEELKGSREYYDYKERCVFCDIVRQEIASQDRVVVENDHFICIEPFASRFPFETWILPKKHSSMFEAIQKTEIISLARAIKEILTRLKAALKDPPFNLMLHTAPCDDGQSVYYHWHFEITPRLTKVAGFEWGSGFYINPTPPEDAARYLRELELDEL